MSIIYIHYQIVPLADKIYNKFSRWKGSCLSFAERLTFIKLVITSFLLHSFTIYKWPSFLISYVERSIRNFLWSGSADDKKIVTIPWKLYCLPIKEGGLGIKQLKVLNDTMLSKLAWNLLSSYSDFAIFVLRKRFLHCSGIPRQNYLQSSVWSSIKGIYSSLRLDCLWFIGAQSKLNF